MPRFAVNVSIYDYGTCLLNQAVINTDSIDEALVINQWIHDRNWGILDHFFEDREVWKESSSCGVRYILEPLAKASEDISDSIDIVNIKETHADKLTRDFVEVLKKVQSQKKGDKDA